MGSDPDPPSDPAGPPAAALPADATRFRERVGLVVRAIPPGRVATYGRVARWAGSPRAARQVGAALRGLSADAEREVPGGVDGEVPGGGDGEVPWWRVVSAAGELSTRKLGFGDLQAALLRSEGVPVTDGRVPLASRLWEGPGEAEGPGDERRDASDPGPGGDPAARGA